MKVLMATDGSEFSAEAVRKCCEMVALKKDASIRIISVIEIITPTRPFGVADDYYGLVQKAAAGIADVVVEEARRKMRTRLGEEIEIGTLTIIGNPKEMIVREARKWGADLIVVGSHGRGFWGRMLLGSVSDAVVRHAPCSVLVIRGKQDRK